MYKKLETLFIVTLQNLNPEREEDVLFRVKRGLEFLRIFFSNSAFIAEDWKEWQRLLCHALKGASLAEHVLRAAVLSTTTEEVAEEIAEELRKRDEAYREFEDDPEAMFWLQQFRAAGM